LYLLLSHFPLIHLGQLNEAQSPADYPDFLWHLTSNPPALPELAERLNELSPLYKEFPGEELKDGYLHIIVTHPSFRTRHLDTSDEPAFKRVRLDAPQTPPRCTPPSAVFQVSPRNDIEAIGQSIAKFLNKYRSKFEELIRNAQDVSSLIPSWEPSYTPDKALSDHLSRLRIPRSQDGQPSLLLHNLGVDEKFDTSASDVMEETFSNHIHTCVTNPGRASSITNAFSFQNTNQHCGFWQDSSAPSGIMPLVGVLSGHGT
jgi:hypothetical protein